MHPKVPYNFFLFKSMPVVASYLISRSTKRKLKLFGTKTDLSRRLTLTLFA